MFQHIPPELKAIIFPLLSGHDLLSLATLCRDFHHLALYHTFNRNHVFESNNRIITIQIDTTVAADPETDSSSIDSTKAETGMTKYPFWSALEGARPRANRHPQVDDTTIILRALLLALPTALPCSPKILSCITCEDKTTSYEPHQYKFFEILGYIKRLIQHSVVGTGLEEVILDFSGCFQIRWLYLPSPPPPVREDKAITAGDIEKMIPLHELLYFIAFKSRCMRLKVLNGHPSRANWSLPRISVIHTSGTYKEPSSGTGGWLRPLTKLGRKGRTKPGGGGDSESLQEPSNLRVLHLHSSFLFHITIFSVCTLKLLSSLHSGSSCPHGIEVLSLQDTRRSHEDWALILPEIYLPNLRELYLNDSNVNDEDLTKFLSRHPKLINLDIGYATGYDAPSPHDIIGTNWRGRISSKPSLNFLPNVESLAAIPSFIDSYLGRGTSFLPPTQIFCKLKTLTINSTIYTDQRFFISGLNIGLSSPKVLNRLKQLTSISLRLSIQNTFLARHGLTLTREAPSKTLEWLRINEIEDPSSAYPIQECVTTLVLVSKDNPLFLRTEEARRLFPVWLNRFLKVDKVVIKTKEDWEWDVIGEDGHDVDWVRKLAVEIIKHGKAQYMLEVNGSAKVLGEWI